MNRTRNLMTRRGFVGGVAASAVLAAHEVLGGRALGAQAFKLTLRKPESRIERVRLLTVKPLAEMAAFYRDVLELPIEGESANELTVRAGASRLTFVASDGAGPGSPFYHFAFNIPENKIRSARAWQMARGPLFTTPPRLRDPEYPPEVRHFRSWDAHSVFFFDPAGNVVEYIARHTLDNADTGGFSSRDLLCVSEIAFVVDDVPACASRIEKTFGLVQYQGAGDQFHAVGDEHGLLLVFARGRPLGLGSGKTLAGDVFETEAWIRGGREGKIEFKEYGYGIVGE